MSVQEIIEAIEKMSLMEVNELVEALKEKFGVTGAIAVAGGAAAGAAAAPAEEQTEFKIVLKEVGANKIGVIKVVKDVTGLGLVESKALAVDGATIKENVSKEDAAKIVAQFKEAGAVAEAK